MSAAIKEVKDSSEIDLNKVFEALNNGQIILKINSSCKLVHINENLEKLFGILSSDVLGKDFSVLFNEDYTKSDEYEDLWNKISKGTSLQGVYPFQHKSGGPIWLQCLFHPVQDNSGKLDYIYFIATDITAIKQDLQVRIDIMNQTSIVSESDLKGDILNINQKFIETSQYSKEELVGHPHNTTRHPDMPKEVFKQLWSTIGRGGIFRGVVKNRKKDGTPYYVDAVIAPIIGSNGKPKKYLGVRYDITEQEIERHNMKGVFNAIDSSYAFIEFDTSGNILNANSNFLTTMKYQLEEIKGKHHRIFVESNYAATPAYSQFWADLKMGKSHSELIRRITREGKDVWLQAVYTPVKDEMGRVVKIIKLAQDVTEANQKAVENKAKLDGVSKVQAVIEFTTDGKILTANENFLNAMGYTLEEIKEKHHRIFCESSYTSTSAYSDFWAKLGRGEFELGRFKRVSKSGKIVWIFATYFPVVDLTGKILKVVKFATDISTQVEVEESVTRLANEFTSSSKDISKKQLVWRRELRPLEQPQKR